MTKKAAVISVHDFKREEYAAFYEIVVREAAMDRFEWAARIYRRDPVGHVWDGKVHDAYPEDVPKPVYPTDGHLLRKDQYLKLDLAGQLAEQARQAAFRAACAKVYEAHPKAVHLATQQSGAEATEEEARIASQKWVAAEMEKHRIKPATVNGYAIPMPLPDLLDVFCGAPWRRFKRQALRKARELVLMALAYATATRNTRVQQVQIAVDAGSGPGLWRIYNGTRPASGGTATTKLAELTFSDPCAPSASGGVLTFSSITPDSSADATGTATWFRTVDSTGTFCVDGDCGTSGSDLNLNSTSINIGVQVSVTSATITEGNP